MQTKTINRAIATAALIAQAAMSANLKQFTTKENTIFAKHEYLTIDANEARKAEYRLFFDKNDSLFSTQPRSLILNNLNCGSGADSHPICSTYVVFKDSPSIIHPLHKVDFTINSLQSNELSDSLLQNYFRSSPTVSQITLRHYEEIDRGWAFLEGFMFGTLTFMASAAAELLHSQVASQSYNIEIPGLIGASTFLAFSGYRYFTIDTKPTCTIYNIHFTANF